jgi:hypothetical protein
MVYVVEHKDPGRVAAGLKAAIHNPNVSEEAKERAAEKLEKLPGNTDSGHSTGDQDTNRVLGGYKATLTVSFAFVKVCSARNDAFVGVE